MRPEIISGFHVRWYGVLFALGFILGYNILTKIFKAENKPDKLMDGLLTYVMLGTIIGARLGHCLFYEPEYYIFNNPLEIFKVWKGGLASHGGALGIFIAIYYFSKSYKQPYLWVLDRLAIVVPLAGALIRLGNFFNSEIIGNASDAPWAVVFTKFDATPRHPAQMYESLCYLVIFFISYFGFKYVKVFKYKGFLFGVFLTLIFGSRFCIEFFKRNQVDFEEGMILNMGQILSIPLVIAGLFFIIRSFRLNSNEASS